MVFWTLLGAPKRETSHHPPVALPFLFKSKTAKQGNVVRSRRKRYNRKKGDRLFLVLPFEPTRPNGDFPSPGLGPMLFFSAVRFSGRRASPILAGNCSGKPPAFQVFSLPQASGYSSESPSSARRREASMTTSSLCLVSAMRVSSSFIWATYLSMSA